MKFGSRSIYTENAAATGNCWRRYIISTACCTMILGQNFRPMIARVRTALTFEQRIYQALKRKGLSPQFERAGVYAILLDGKIVYIGKSHNILQRMAQHYAGMRLQSNHKYCVLSGARRYGHRIRFSILYAAAAGNSKAITEEIGQKEGEYIRRYRPPLNYQIPKEENWHEFTTNPRSMTISLSDLLERGNSD